MSEHMKKQIYEDSLKYIDRGKLRKIVPYYTEEEFNLYIFIQCHSYANVMCPLPKGIDIRKNGTMDNMSEKSDNSDATDEKHHELKDE